MLSMWTTKSEPNSFIYRNCSRHQSLIANWLIKARRFCIITIWCEMKMGWNECGVKWKWGEMNVGWNERGVKWTWGEMIWGEVIWGEVIWGEMILGWNERTPLENVLAKGVAFEPILIENKQLRFRILSQQEQFSSLNPLASFGLSHCKKNWIICQPSSVETQHWLLHFFLDFWSGLFSNS